MLHNQFGRKICDSMRAALIGVACQNNERDIASEFFELFKTPWEFFNEDVNYSIMLSSDGYLPKTNAKLIFLYNSKITSFDIENGISVGLGIRNARLDSVDQGLPISGSVIPLISSWSPVLKISGTGQTVGIIVRKNDQTIIRLGYDLFKEVYDLLSNGQSANSAVIPSLEIHIAMLRNWILDAGIPMVEIPPVPEGYDFMCCLTHDVDFAGIRKHGLDRTVVGFLWRATVGSLAEFIRGRKSTKYLIANWKAALGLPAIWLGLKKDFWIQFKQYLNIEKDLSTTYFFIPDRDKPGRDPSGRVHPLRAAKYDICDLQIHIRDLARQGCEIGLHGLDAWNNPAKGKEEARQIATISGKECKGARMHWLYFDRNSPRVLDEAGFLYDSTLGYNDAVGYRGGTVQAYRPFGASRLLELPLHIQDSALFYPKRMKLREGEALDLCEKLIENSHNYGGGLVINWHDRSIAPERLWGDFYMKVLAKIRKHKVWFGTCAEVAHWFLKRRSAKFRILADSFSPDSTYSIELEPITRDHTPALFLRVYCPTVCKKGDAHSEKYEPVDDGYYRRDDKMTYIIEKISLG